MNANLFSKSKLSKALENLQLTDDEILGTVKFIKSIDDACKTAHNMAYSPIPDITELSAINGIKQIMLSRFDSKTYLFTEGSLYLDILGFPLGGILKGASIDKILPRKKCPSARMAIDLI